MPNTDIRIQVTFPAHWKTRKLERLAGDAGVKCLIFLWCFAGVNKCDGILTGMSDLDIEDAAYWTGIPKQFVTALIECGFLEGEESNRSLHDWGDHNKWCAEFSIRSERNRKSIESRWNTSRIQDEYEMNTSCCTTSKVRKGKEGEGKAGKEGNGSVSQDSVKSQDLPVEYKNLVLELLPHLKAYPVQLAKQADSLDKLIRIDRKNIAGDVSEEAWKREVFAILRWARRDVQDNGKWQGWSKVFDSISRTRNDACRKFLNMRRGFHDAVEFKPEIPPPDPSAETQDEFFEKWQKESGHDG